MAPSGGKLLLDNRDEIVDLLPVGGHPRGVLQPFEAHVEVIERVGYRIAFVDVFRKQLPNSLVGALLDPSISQGRLLLCECELA